MLHERGLLYLSDNRSPTLLSPCTFGGELGVNGDDCPSWRVSRVKFIICLNKTTRAQCTYEMADSHRKTTTTTTTTTTIEDRARNNRCIFVLPVENPSFVHLFFMTIFFKFYCIKRVARTKSPHRASARAERTDGITTS